VFFVAFCDSDFLASLPEVYDPVFVWLNIYTPFPAIWIVSNLQACYRQEEWLTLGFFIGNGQMAGSCFQFDLILASSWRIVQLRRHDRWKI